MEVDANGVLKHVTEHVVFDHLGRHAHQGQGVVVVAAVIAGHVQRTNHLSMRIENGRA